MKNSFIAFLLLSIPLFLFSAYTTTIKTGFADSALEVPHLTFVYFNDTVPVKSDDPMQQLFDAVDKMERKLEDMGKKQEKDTTGTSGNSGQALLMELERTIKHIEDEITKTFQQKNDSIAPATETEHTKTDTIKPGEQDPF